MYPSLHYRKARLCILSNDWKGAMMGDVLETDTGYSDDLLMACERALSHSCITMCTMVKLFVIIYKYIRDSAFTPLFQSVKMKI